MIRVLQLPGSIEKRNGRMSVIMNVYREIYKKVQFDFVCTDYGFENYQKEIEKLGGKVYMLSDKNTTIHNIRKGVDKLLSTNNYSFLHYHAISKWGCALSLAHKYGVGTIVHSHATKMSDSYIKGIRNRLFSLNIIFNADKRIAVSPEAGQKLFLWQKFKYIPNMVNYRLFAFQQQNRELVRKKYNIDSNTVLIGNVGRISKQKNQKFAIIALARLINKTKSNHYKLMIIGDADKNGEVYLRKLKRLISKYNLKNNVILTGLVNDIEKYYSAFDIFWLPSLFEGQPTVGIEAQANGLNLLVSNTVSESMNATKNVSFLKIKRKYLDTWFSKTIEVSKKRDKYSIYKLQESEFNRNRILSEWLNLYFQ